MNSVLQQRGNPFDYISLSDDARVTSAISIDRSYNSPSYLHQGNYKYPGLEFMIDDFRYNTNRSGNGQQCEGENSQAFSPKNQSKGKIYEDSKEVYDLEPTIDQEEVQYYGSRPLICLMKGDYTAAKHYFQQEIDKSNCDGNQDPRRLRSYFGLGYCYYRLGGEAYVNEAIKTYKIVEELNPNLPEVHYNLGCCFYKLGKLERAKEYLEKSFKLKSQDTYTIYLLSRLYKDLGDKISNKEDSERAIIYYTKAIEINRKSALCYCRRGKAYNSNDRQREASSDFKAAITLIKERGYDSRDSYEDNFIQTTLSIYQKEHKFPANCKRLFRRMC